ncbi:PREDICTED: putative F-box/LRR-repeat protein 23 isoform X2 [Populus euphratica]|nr:PREDICTED: putative F-box/LRR-repeat protein 23 isoform X2 [Populus euphratica]
MEERKWEDLEFYCLVNVLGRVGMKSLLLDVPFVCKSWYKASLDPSCWKYLVFPKDLDSELDFTLIDRFKEKYKIENCSVDAFTKFAVGRSHGNCTGLYLPNGCTEEVAKYVADECPALITLSLPYDSIRCESSIVPSLIGKWEHLENLWLGSSENLVNIITQISLACNKFSGLRISSAIIQEEEASAIVTNLPNIKFLLLRGARIYFENLVIILQGCKNLVHLDVRDCLGFDSDDEAVLELASNIKTFNCEGSTLHDYDDGVIDHDDLVYDGYISN